VAVDTQFKIKKSFKLLADEACYLLSVEIQMPLDVVTLQSNVPVLLLDVVTNNAMVSHTAPPPGDTETKLLAAYRCQDATNRIEIKIRTVEGQHGNLKVYVIPKLTPKTCQMAEIHIKPLSLHAKVSPTDIEEALRTRPINTLTLTGDFSLSEVHSWVGSCLPSVTPRLNTEESTIAFTSTFLNTVLLCEYRQGSGVFKSDSISVISILKEVITKEATQRKTMININLNIKDTSVDSYLLLLKPILDHHFSLSKRHSLIAPLNEIQTHEGDVTFLADEYQEILKTAAQIKAEFKIAPQHLGFLKKIVTDLYVDRSKVPFPSAVCCLLSAVCCLLSAILS
jgi:Bardet-Biedl syndrome 7 protein